MATDHDQFSLPVEDPIFLDDIILRLLLLAADVRGDERLEELLDWVDQLQAVRATLQELLSQLDGQFKTLEASFRTVIYVDSIDGMCVSQSALTTTAYPLRLSYMVNTTKSPCRIST
jgi:hypothetical protein